MPPATSDICKAKEENQAPNTSQKQAKMRAINNRVTDEIPARVKELIIFNHEYKKIICSGRKCGKAIKLDELREHLGRKHNVNVHDSSKVRKIAHRLGWDERLWGNVRPEDGSAPQVGLAVRDGFRCPYCRRCVSVFSKDIDFHWEYAHDGGEAWRAEKVQFQTWDGSFRDGYYRRYWVVAEGIRSDGEEAGPAEEEPMEEEGPAEEAPMEEAAAAGDVVSHRLDGWC
jgi:hypothetical protein